MHSFFSVYYLTSMEKVAAMVLYIPRLENGKLLKLSRKGFMKSVYVSCPVSNLLPLGFSATIDYTHFL